MILSGYTDDRLSEIKTYDENNPYQVGYNGVTQITTDIGGNIDSVEYIIDNIRYITNIGKAFFPDNNEKFSSETIYFFESSGLSEEKINLIKKEVEMSISEPPKVEEEIFIERQETSVFERHLRMGEIKTLEQLEEYKNGYYNIFKLR
jgi:hypothetical protein